MTEMGAERVERPRRHQRRLRVAFSRPTEIGGEGSAIDLNLLAPMPVTLFVVGERAPSQH
jgi:hypothetical protein